MHQWKRISLLILCSHFCASQLYLGGFPSRKYKDSCLCFERVPYTTNLPMDITIFFPAPKEEEYEEFNFLKGYE